MGLLDDLKAKGNKIAADVSTSLSGPQGAAGTANAAAEKLFHDLGAITHLESVGRADAALAAEKERVLGELANLEATTPLQPVLKSVAPPPPGAAAGPPPPPGANAAAPPPAPGAAAAPPAPGAAAPPPAPAAPPVAPPPAPAAPPVAPPPAPASVSPPPPPAGMGEG